MLLSAFSFTLLKNVWLLKPDQNQLNAHFTGKDVFDMVLID